MQIPFLPVVIFLITVFVVRPFGEFPINDDWQYAMVVKNFAETNNWIVDPPFAPSLVLQGLLTYPFIKLFGFSHLLLRIITIGVAIVFIFLFDRILNIFIKKASVRNLLGLILVFNPLFFHVATSYMTELYGFCLVFLAVYLWFKGEKEGSYLPKLPWFYASVFIAALSFWTRQFCVAVYPALLGASYLFKTPITKIFSQLNSKDRKHIFFATVMFVAIIGSYFVWARLGNNIPRNFSGPLEKLFTSDIKFYLYYTGYLFIYMTAFSFPIIWGIKRHKISKVPLIVVAVFVLTSIVYAQLKSDVVFNPSSYVSSNVFPFLHNVIYSGGIGPVTLTDVFWEKSNTAPSTPKFIWILVTLLIFVSSLRWSTLVSKLNPLKNKSNFLNFAILFFIGNFILVGQSYGRFAFDRYFFPSFLGLLFLMAFLLKDQEVRVKRALIFLIPLMVFTITGIHNYFRWNDTRWDLYRHAEAQGVDSLTIDGGYELNGWLNTQKLKGSKDLVQCVGKCHCTGVCWSVYDKSYRITMTKVDKYQVMKTDKPKFWLIRPPEMYLLKRK